MVNPVQSRFNRDYADSSLAMRLAATKTLDTTDSCTQLRIERLQGLTHETKALSDRDQMRCKELFDTMGRIENVRRFETSVNLVGSGICAAAAVAGGSPLMAGIAVCSGFHQFLSRTEGYHHLASAFTNDPEKQAQLGKAIQDYIGYLSITGTFANLFIGGPNLIEKGLEGMSEVVSGTTALHTFTQAGSSITQSYLEEKKIERQGEGYLINDQLAKMDLERQEVNEAIQESLSFQSKALSQTTKAFERDAETQKQIIKKGS